MTSTPTIPQDPYLQRMVTLAREDLASRLAVEIDQIELLALEAVTWPDASLGCPLPGMRYKQVPQDGLLIRLSAEGRAYEYHSGANRDPFLCEQAGDTSKIKPPAPDSFAPPGALDD